MNNPAIRTAIIVVLALAAILAYASTFIVSQTQNALVLRFGAVRSEIRNSPGLKFKLPLVENVIYVERRILDLDLPVQNVLSADRQNLEVDAFARYRIVEPLRFFQAANNVQLANQRLVSFTNSAMRNILAGATFNSIIRTERDVLMNRIQSDVNRSAAALGIEIVDLRLTRVDLPAANSQAVFSRMQTERQREAADLRANGAQQAQTIRARAERESTVIVAEATRRSDELRGQGEAEKNRILAEAFQRDPDFFAFYRSMQAYEAGLKAGDTRMVLSPDMPFFRYFSDPNGRGRAGASPAAPGRSAPVAPIPGGTSSIVPAPAAPQTAGVPAAVPQ
jgi:membrane protease subunit HflC